MPFQTSHEPHMATLPSYESDLATLQARCVDYPATVSIETFVHCNAAYDFCPYPQLTRKGDLMSDALFEKIIEDLESIPVRIDSM